MATEATTVKDEQLLFSINSERIVLGVLLSQPENFTELTEKLKPEDFYRKAHRGLYSTILRLQDRHGEPPDLMFLTEYLEAKGKIEAVGGDLYLVDLVRDAVGQGLLSVLPHVKIISNYALRRRLRDVSQQIATLAYDEQEEDEQRLAKAEGIMHSLSTQEVNTDLVSGADTADEFMSWLEKRSQEKVGAITGVPSGILDFDRMTGGFQPQELYILGGRPGQGKTSLMLNMILHALERTENSMVVFSLEMSRRDLMMRLVSMRAAIDSRFLRIPSLLDDEQYKRIIEATDFLASERWFVDESGKLSISDMRMKCRRHKAKYGLDFILVDYLQCMSGIETQGKRSYNRVEEVGEISRGLKQLAKEFDVPVLAAASLNRSSNQRSNKRPQMSDLRDSGNIEFDADLVMFISRCEEEEDMKNISILDVVKHRNGPQGEISLYFDAQYTRFRSLEV